MFQIGKLFQSLQKDTESAKNEMHLTREQAAEILRTSPEALTRFEESYRVQALENPDAPTPFFGTNAKKEAEQHRGVMTEDPAELDDIIRRIVANLVQETSIWSWDGYAVNTVNGACGPPAAVPVTREEILALPEEFRPQLTEHLMVQSLAGDSSDALLYFYREFQNAKSQEQKAQNYHMFRQGLDLLDLDPVAYEMLGMNPNAMGYWLPAILPAVHTQGFFRVPKTTIIKVPLTLLQMSRLDYALLTRTTLDICDRYCMEVFGLDLEKEYFIKTGTYSSKFDFRNAKVTGIKEVRELGEYLLFLSNQAVCMAGPTNRVCHYGVSTTNEWVVREYIPDQEKNPSIYCGMPLHTEYRLFVDFDKKCVMDCVPYWDPEVMKQRLGHGEDAGNPHNIHDYTVYLAHEEMLMGRYRANRERVVQNMEEVLREDCGLTGQWSVDVMQNGGEFWFIDMALAANSALMTEKVKKELAPVAEDWIPKLPE